MRYLLKEILYSMKDYSLREEFNEPSSLCWASEIIDQGMLRYTQKPEYPVRACHSRDLSPKAAQTQHTKVGELPEGPWCRWLRPHGQRHPVLGQKDIPGQYQPIDAKFCVLSPWKHLLLLESNTCALLTSTSSQRILD